MIKYPSHTNGSKLVNSLFSSRIFPISFLFFSCPEDHNNYMSIEAIGLQKLLHTPNFTLHWILPLSDLLLKPGSLSILPSSLEQSTANSPIWSYTHFTYRLLSPSSVWKERSHLINCSTGLQAYFFLSCVVHFLLCRRWSSWKWMESLHALSMHPLCPQNQV